eukprot:12924516-Prorocentrum_lima.AAC.1
MNAHTYALCWVREQGQQLQQERHKKCNNTYFYPPPCHAPSHPPLQSTVLKHVVQHCLQHVCDHPLLELAPHQHHP